MPDQSRRRAQFLLTVPIVGVLVWAAVAKLAANPAGPTMYEAFTKQYHFLWWLVPGCEILLGLWLLTGLRRRAATTVAIVVLSSFTGLIVAEMLRHHPLPCGCMGAAAALYDPSAIRWGLGLSLGRNLLMIGGCAFLFLQHPAPAAKQVNQDNVMNMPATDAA